MASKKQSFEENLLRLEEITSLLENGTASLEEMLTLFDEGVKLTKNCMSQLDKAEQKVNVLVKNSSGETVSEPFETDK